METPIVRAAELCAKLKEVLGIMPDVLIEIIVMFCGDSRLERLWAMMKPGICQLIMFPYGATQLNHLNICHDCSGVPRCASGDDMMNHDWRVTASFANGRPPVQWTFNKELFVTLLASGKLHEKFSQNLEIRSVIMRFEQEFADLTEDDVKPALVKKRKPVYSLR